MNRVALARYGYDAAEFLFMTLRDLVLDEVPASPSSEPGRDSARHRTKDGRILDVQTDASVVQWDGRPARLMLVHDVTEHTQLKAQLSQSQRMEVIGQLAGGIAHDFNNLLLVILGSSELALMQLQDRPEVAAEVGEIQKAGERASRLTRQLLAFSRKQPMLPQVLDLNALIGDLSTMLHRVIGEDIYLNMATEPSLGHVKADRSQMEQLLLNLVVNARDAMPRGGVLTITTANVVVDTAFAQHAGIVAGHHVSLIIRDTGRGMEPNVLAHVFEPFFTTKGPGEGTGLGLSTVYGVVKQSGGHIMVESTPGVHTTFTLYLPRVDAPLTHATSDAKSPGSLRGTETILVVEDDADARGLICRMLERYGYRVLAAQDVADALALEKRHPGSIDLLVTDIVMPGLSGPELAERLVRRRPEIKVLYVSGLVGQPVLAGGVDPDSSGYLQKPFAAEALAAKVRHRLGPNVLKS